jgi:hypothetical protein
VVWIRPWFGPSRIDLKNRIWTKEKNNKRKLVPKRQEPDCPVDA